MATRCIYAKANSYNPGFDTTPRPIGPSAKLEDNPLGQPSVMNSGTVHPNRSSFTRSINHPDQHAYVHGYSRRAHADTQKKKYYYYDGRPGGGSYFDSYYLDPFIYADSYVYTNPTRYNDCTYPIQTTPYGLSSSSLSPVCGSRNGNQPSTTKVNIQPTTNSKNYSFENLKNEYLVRNNNMSNTSYYNLGSCLCIILIIAFLYLIFRRR